MDPLNTINGAIANIVSSIPARADNDRIRIEAFVKGAVVRGLEIINTGDPSEVSEYFIRFSFIVGEFANVVSSLVKFQFPKDIWSGKFKDPFKASRAKVRAFAKEWGFPEDVQKVL